MSIAVLMLGARAIDAIRSLDRKTPAGPEGVGTITTIAGSNRADFSTGDGGLATDAQLEYPVDVALDGLGNVYILENGIPGRVRKVDPSGRITTVVGPPAGGEPAAAEAAQVNTDLAYGFDVDAVGNIYVAAGHTQVLKITSSGDVTTVAGTGETGFSGDGGPATEARLRKVWDVAVDARGDLFISGNNRIREVDPSGVIRTIAGTGRSAFSGDGGPAIDTQLGGPTGVAVDQNGDVYVLDYRNGRIRRIDAQGIITTIAGPGERHDGCRFGGDGGPALEAGFCGPEHLSIDPEGNIYVADTYANRIRRIDTNGIITTVAGSGPHAFGGDGGPATDAQLSEPSSVAVGPDGALYIADSGNHRIRKVIL